MIKCYQAIVFLLLLLSLVGCEKKYEAPVPSLSWDEYNAPGAIPLTFRTRQAAEGVYSVTDGADMFGEQVALKWSFLIKGKDTTYYLSAFCEKDVSYIVLEGKRAHQTLYFEGYWRKIINTETGIVRFTIAADKGGKWLSADKMPVQRDSIIFSGVFGNNQDLPLNKITFKYQRPLNLKPLAILAHRGGGRTSDLLPASENSVEIVKLASRLGATGIEIDIRLTKDGIPILYHDNSLNLRLTQKNGLVGPIEEYTYQQLYTFVRLINGERIPTLAEVLDATLRNTNLSFVWLDTKYVGSLQVVRKIQKEYLQKADAAGRKLEIVIGLPETKAVDMYLALPDYASAPALCELDMETVRQTKAQIWAPRWTLGTQLDAVVQMKAEGRRVFVWTLDVPQYIQQYQEEGDFDGMLSNYPSIVAYYHYTQL
ncbi:MAG: glycerophosphodiester phosphodiesterase [Bacteroidota bacterium]